AYVGVRGSATAPGCGAAGRRGVVLAVSSAAPAGSGLGGSSALVTSVVKALAELGERSLAPHQLAELSYRIERMDVGIAGGMQDQYAAAFGGFNVIAFSASGVEVTPIGISTGTLAALQERLL